MEVVFASGPPTQCFAQALDNVFGAWVQERKVKEREGQVRLVVDAVEVGEGKTWVADYTNGGS